MSSHYYSKNPEVKHDRQLHEVSLRGNTLRFMTDAGVFSKSGVDYGSRVLIDSIALEADDQVLDVGCGYGPIGLTLSKLAKDGHVTMIDINERAVELSRENARLNNIANVTVLQSDVYSAVAGRSFQVIATNPPIRAGKATVHRIFEEGYELLTPGGSMWVVIQKKQGAPSAKAKLETLFERVEQVTKDKGYYIFRAIKSLQI